MKNLLERDSLSHFLQIILTETSKSCVTLLSTLLADGGGVGGGKVPLPKICHTYLTMMKLGTVIPYLKEIQSIYESRDAPLEFCWHQNFFTRNQQIWLYQYRYRLFIILLTFLEALKIFVIYMVTVLIMSAKMDFPDLLKKKRILNS